MASKFDDELTYPADEVAATPRITAQTLNVWRCQGKEPRYLKAGRQILYRGAVLNA